LVEKFTRYFTPQVFGLENIPAKGPALVVGNHSCSFYMPDAWVTATALEARRGFDQPSYGLGYDLLFGLPGIGSFLRKVGTLPARGNDAEEALRQGAALLVYPGGDWEACRPWTQRNTIDFAGRQGFVRLALRTGVPVIPVVGYGSHDAIVVVTRGEKLARAMGLRALRVKVFPLFLSPFGITSMLFPPLPMPSSVIVDFLEPLDWSQYGPGADGDPEIVRACYEQITGVMQDRLDRLHDENPHPVLRGVERIARGKWRTSTWTAMLKELGNEP
jgi:1-acyl-sn-glycerol-3-phosphate acyltransferase